MRGKQPRKVLVVSLRVDQHRDLTRIARDNSMTLANYIRKKLDLPLEIAKARNDLAEQ